MGLTSGTDPRDFLDFSIIAKIEELLSKYASSNYGNDDVEFYFGKSRYDIDLEALKNNLNIPIRDFILRGGKRLRPLLFCTCLQSFGKDYKKYLDIAVLIEEVHNATLVLDDIEDNGKLRRGKPTLHKKFGIDTAVNTGFAMHVLPLRLLIKNGKHLSKTQKNRLWEVYAEELINVAGGQAIDIYWHKVTPKNVTERQYLEMVRLKTGSLMRMSFRMACIVANKSNREEEIYKNFAESLGMAFQIKDDILDLKSANAMFGKSYGNDISEGKISLPVVYALKNVSKKEKSRLIEILSMHTHNKRHIKKAISIIVESGSVRKTSKFAEELVDNAWLMLEKQRLGNNNLHKLRDITYYLIKRNY
jgi:geranylgeranyl diphosphate synthase type I